MSDIRSPTVAIADGVAMLLLGLGTWQASDREAYHAVRTALDLGYRLIDTATMYGNEAAIGTIGVSNYSTAEIDELTDATGVVPAVNQIEWTPALYDASTVVAHRDRGVTLEGYSPLKAADLGDPVLLAVAEDHGVTVPQVILRWHLEHGFVAIPKSTDAGRLAENFGVFGFSLDGDEIARIDSLAG